MAEAKDPKKMPDGCAGNVLCDLLLTKKTKMSKEDGVFDPSKLDDSDEGLMNVLSPDDKDAINHFKKHESIKTFSTKMFDNRSIGEEIVAKLKQIQGKKSRQKSKVSAHEAMKQALDLETP